MRIETTPRPYLLTTPEGEIYPLDSKAAQRVINGWTRPRIVNQVRFPNGPDDATAIEHNGYSVGPATIGGGNYFRIVD